jgi:signal transduction histidine kinase
MNKTYYTYWHLLLVITFGLVLLFTGPVFSQKIDSLEIALQNTSGKEKIKLLNTLSEEYLLENPAKSIEYAQKALIHAQVLEDTNLIARGYLNIGHAFRYQSSYQKALDSLYRTIPMIENINASLRTQIINLIGMLHQDLGHDTLSTRAFLNKIKSNKNPDYIRKNTRILSKISNYYKNNKNYKKALSYALRLAIFQKIANDTTSLIKTMNKICAYYLQMGMYRQALSYGRIASKQASALNGKERLKATIYNNLGKAHSHLGDNNSAIKAFIESNKLAHQLKDTSLLINNALYLGKINAENSNHQKALQYFDTASVFAHEKNRNNIFANILIEKAQTLLETRQYSQAARTLKHAEKRADKKSFKAYASIYNILSKLYEKQGSQSKSLHYLKKYITYKDSLNQEEKQKAIEKVKSNYEVDKKEQRINLLKKDSRIKELELSRDKARINMLIIGLSALVVVIVLIIVLYHNKIKTNRVLALQNHQIKEQNEELNIINERLLETEKHLKKSNATKDKFFSIIAHDIKSPLNSFRSIIYSLKNSKTQTPETIFNYLDELDYYSSTTMELLNNLLLWARSQDEDIEPNYKEFDLIEVIEESKNNLYNNLRKKAINIKMPETKNVIVRTDRNMIEFITRNLINNAIKFTPKGGKINIQVSSENDDVTFSVIDNGQGMDEETKHKIENKDYISNPGTEKEKGTGLGLSMCQYFLSKINGTLNVESEPGKGTRIDVILPNSRITNT